MCGIFGHFFYDVEHSRRDILQILFNGLQRLEYRGYDSAGIAVNWTTDATIHRQRKPGKPIVLKAPGKVSELSKMCMDQLQSQNLDVKVDAHIGIAHTRWATHGPPCARNSHPHVSSEEHEFVVVHNGTITNYRALREFLTKEGAVFVSDTDTEVIPKLLHFLYGKVPQPLSFPELVSEVCKQLEGAYAILVQSPLYPGELVACRRGSPLIMGVKSAPTNHEQPSIIRSTSLSVKITSRDTKWFQDVLDSIAESDAMECYLASEASAVVEHTKQVIYLEDNDLVHLRGGSYTVYNFGAGESPEEVRRTVQTLTMEVSQIMKGGYNHYMQKEINEQPETLNQTMQGRVLLDAQPVELPEPNPYTQVFVRLAGIMDHAKAIKRSRRLVFVACGTSYYACMAARQTLEELAELPVALEIASDLLDRRPPIFRDDTCFFVSQSGETADTMGALRYAKACGALCVGITNTVGSAIDRETDTGIHINAGCEIGVASTKAYTSQIITLTLTALSLCEDSIAKRPYCNDLVNGLAALPAAVKRALDLQDSIKALAEDLKDENSLLVFGRGRNYATAMEAALKVKEVSYMHSEGINAGEMKHGPLALVDETLPIIVVATQDAMHNKMQGVIQQLLARKARLIIMCNEGDTETEAVCAFTSAQLIRVPKVHDALQPVVNIIPLQLLAYHLTLLRGYDVDQPRNLAKSVTVTEE